MPAPKGTLVQGIGINDSPASVSKTINGERFKDPAYSVWKNLLVRINSKGFHKQHPTYIGCTVCDEWLYFMNFRNWFYKQNWKGNQLDKDLILPGNKHYCPENCCLVSLRLNSLLNDCGSARGKYPIGVCWDKSTKSFKTSCNDKDGKPAQLGRYKTEIEAHKAYVDYKSSLIKKIAYEQTDPRIKKGLLLHANILLNSIKPKLKEVA